jgi:glycosyltransferase involved in cell wall biosynthesis
VNESIANLYKEKYGNQVQVMRNIPEGKPEGMEPNTTKVSRAALGLPKDKTILIVQGTGINVDRGNKELVDAMRYMDGFLLLIIGSGDVLPRLKEIVLSEGLREKVIFKDKMPYEQLKFYTAASDGGISIDKDTNINYRYSLPNKLFDFIHAEIPCIVSDLPEVKRIVHEFKVGTVLSSHNPKEMAEEITRYFQSYDKEELQAHARKATLELTWENEEKVLEEIYKD